MVFPTKASEQARLQDLGALVQIIKWGLTFFQTQ
jgi:hypothetical protein